MVKPIILFPPRPLHCHSLQIFFSNFFLPDSMLHEEEECEASHVGKQNMSTIEEFEQRKEAEKYDMRGKKFSTYKRWIFIWSNE